MGCGGLMLILQGMSTKLREFQCLKSGEIEVHVNPITYLPEKEICSQHHLQDEEDSSFTFGECNNDTLLYPIDDVDVVGNIDDENKGQGLDSGKSNHQSEDNNRFSKEMVEMKICGKIKEKEEMEEEEEGGDLLVNELYPDPPSFKMYCLDSLIEDSSDEEEEVQRDEDVDRHNNLYNHHNRMGKTSNQESICSNEVSIEKLSKTWKRARRIKKIFNGKGWKMREH